METEKLDGSRVVAEYALERPLQTDHVSGLPFQRLSCSYVDILDSFDSIVRAHQCSARTDERRTHEHNALDRLDDLAIGRPNFIVTVCHHVLHNKAACAVCDEYNW